MSSQTKKPSARREKLIEDIFRAGRENSTAGVFFHNAVSDKLGLSITDEKTIDILLRLGPLTAGEIGKHTGLATASVTLAAVEASIGKMGRNSSNPTSRRPSSPADIAISAVRDRSPESMSARRASTAETPDALATASTIRPASAPCRSPPVKSRFTKSASVSVARPSSSPRISLRAAADPLPVVSWTASIARSSSSIVTDASRVGVRSIP
jgi:hypothetical protein